MMDLVVLVFAKVPRPGSVKTRLTPTLTSAEAARLYAAFLQDTLRKMLRMEADVRLVVAPPVPEKWTIGLPANASVHEQRGETLGARMENAFREAFEAGAERVLVIGTDHPTLPLPYVRRGADALAKEQSVCLGPTEDGGYYLLGMSEFYPLLFHQMSYSHPSVFSETLSRVEETDAEVTVLPRWYDVDTPEDLERLLVEVGREGTEVPNTKRVVDRLDLAVRQGP